MITKRLCGDVYRPGQVVCSNNVLSKFVCRSFEICFERKVTFFRIHAQMKFSFEIRSFEIRKNVIQRKKMNLVSFLTSVVGQVRLGQVRLGQVMLCQVRLGQVRLGQVRLGQVRLGQVGQARLGQARLGQVRLGQVRYLRSLFFEQTTKYIFEQTVKQIFLSLYIVQFVCSINVLSKFERT